jgi:monoamine oxidase
MITGWAAGASALTRWQQAGISGLPALQSAALKTLSAIFGIADADLRRRLLSVHHHSWAADEFSRGAYSYVGIGALRSAELMSAPLEDTLFFAGEHTDVTNQWGTVHGALASGIRAAEQVLQRPPRLS